MATPTRGVRVIDEVEFKQAFVRLTKQIAEVKDAQVHVALQTLTEMVMSLHDRVTEIQSEEDEEDGDE